MDPVARTMVTYTRNLNLKFFMGTTERSVCEVCPDDPSVTLIRKEVWIESDFLKCDPLTEENILLLLFSSVFYPMSMD